MGLVDRTLQQAASELVEDFRGDYEPLAAMMAASWASHSPPPYVYSAAFLQDCFAYPDATFAFAPTIYGGSEPVAFTVGYPRRVLVRGRERRVLICTFLTVAPAHQSSGYGVIVWSDLMRRAVEHGYDGVVNYCVEGEAMDRMIGLLCARLGLPVVQATTCTYLSRSLLGVPARAEAPDASAGELCAAAAVAARCELARLWDDASAGWQLSRVGAVSVCGAAGGGPPAVLTAYVQPIADAVRTRCLVIGDVLWGDLAEREREQLVRELLAKGVAAGASVAIVPELAYSDTTPFEAAGFIASAHPTHAYLSIWSDDTPAEPVDGYYLDLI